MQVEDPDPVAMLEVLTDSGISGLQFARRPASGARSSWSGAARSTT